MLLNVENFEESKLSQVGRDMHSVHSGLYLSL